MLSGYCMSLRISYWSLLFLGLMSLRRLVGMPLTAADWPASGPFHCGGLVMKVFHEHEIFYPFDCTSNTPGSGGTCSEEHQNPSWRGLSSYASLTNNSRILLRISVIRVLTQGIQVTSQTSAWHCLGRCDFREFSCKVVSSVPYNRTLVKVLELRSKG